jgi:hypothetical protein
MARFVNIIRYTSCFKEIRKFKTIVNLLRTEGKVRLDVSKKLFRISYLPLS